MLVPLYFFVSPFENRCLFFGETDKTPWIFVDSWIICPYFFNKTSDLYSFMTFICALNIQLSEGNLRVPFVRLMLQGFRLRKGAPADTGRLRAHRWRLHWLHWKNSWNVSMYTQIQKYVYIYIYIIIYIDVYIYWCDRYTSCIIYTYSNIGTLYHIFYLLQYVWKPLNNERIDSNHRQSGDSTSVSVPRLNTLRSQPWKAGLKRPTSRPHIQKENISRKAPRTYAAM